METFETNRQLPPRIWGLHDGRAAAYKLLSHIVLWMYNMNDRDMNDRDIPTSCRPFITRFVPLFSNNQHNILGTQHTCKPLSRPSSSAASSSRLARSFSALPDDCMTGGGFGMRLPSSSRDFSKSVIWERNTVHSCSILRERNKRKSMRHSFAFPWTNPSTWADYIFNRQEYPSLCLTIWERTRSTRVQSYEKETAVKSLERKWDINGSRRLNHTVHSKTSMDSILRERNPRKNMRPYFTFSRTSGKQCLLLSDDFSKISLKPLHLSGLYLQSAGISQPLFDDLGV